LLELCKINVGVFQISCDWNLFWNDPLFKIPCVKMNDLATRFTGAGVQQLLLPHPGEDEKVEACCSSWGLRQPGHCIRFSKPIDADPDPGSEIY
jgi:hypothetical protein